MQQWALYGVTALEPYTVELLFAFNEARGDTPEVAELAAKLQRPLRTLEAHLQSSPYMVGGRFTVADINMAEILRYAQSHPTLLSDFPTVLSWLTRCQQRPAFQAMWAKRSSEPA